MIDPEIKWVPNGEIPAEPLGDLHTQQNTLSIFEVESDADVERIAAAYMAMRDNPDKFDYVILEASDFDSAEICVEKSAAPTPDDYVNKLHHDLVELTAAKLIKVAKTIIPHLQQRILKKEITRLIRYGIADGTLGTSRMKKRMLEHLNI